MDMESLVLSPQDVENLEAMGVNIQTNVVVGKSISIEDLKGILAVNKDEWAKEAAEIEEFYKTFGDKLPAELKASLETLKNNCK